MERAIARAKRKFFKLVTKLYHTTDQGKIECTTQRDTVTACITENKKIFFSNKEYTTDARQTY